MPERMFPERLVIDQQLGCCRSDDHRRQTFVQLLDERREGFLRTAIESSDFQPACQDGVIRVYRG